MICGLDEVGRGPLAGPVCAAAVVLPPDFPLDILNDSKKLSPKRRDEAMPIIYERAVAWGIGWASAVEIDEMNILQASLLAMQRAFEDMMSRSTPLIQKAAKGGAGGLTAIVDGLYVPNLPIPGRALVKADSQIPEVMAASILAKTARDRMMERYSWLYPDYGYDQHKGYPTAAHFAAIARCGPSPIQRMSFRMEKKVK
ncbi:ribonuclease HII [Spirochaetia bacterium]|nr:ribonuclease HII [Spirochaetia bacterium]